MGTEILLGKLSTKDNITISYSHFKNGFPSLIIICPGFFNSKDNCWIQRTAQLFNLNYDVLVFDFRGHGDSTGCFSWSAKESLDLEAVLNYSQKHKYKNIGIVAFSLAAATALNFVSKRENINSMVLISCPSSFWRIDYHFWEPEMFSDLWDNFSCKWQGKGAKVTHLFLPKPSPKQDIVKIKNTAIFFLHGDKDWIIKHYHSQKLFDLANTYKKIKIIKNGLHAERLIQQYPEMMQELMLAWFSQTLNNN